MNSEAAERLGAMALAWLAQDDELLGPFMAASGADPAQLRAMAAEPGFLGFVLDFVLQDDATVMGLATFVGVRPEDVARARALLPGGDQPHWT
jgi:tetrahydromethanopterin S-methyltransferase subunit C